MNYLITILITSVMIVLLMTGCQVQDYTKRRYDFAGCVANTGEFTKESYDYCFSRLDSSLPETLEQFRGHAFRHEEVENSSH